MKTFGANRCLLVATITFITATVPLTGRAQQETSSEDTALSQPVTQRLYVSDKLFLNVYAQPDQSGGRVATLQTGDSVDELERAGNQVRVRLDDGSEGWVGANYLMSDAPAAIRLRDLQREQKTGTPAPDRKSLDEIARLKKENATLQGRVKELQSRATTLAAALEDAQTADTSEPEVVSEPAQLASVAPSGPGWWSWLLAVALAGAIGYAGGYQTLARRLRRKFGGLRIY